MQFLKQVELWNCGLWDPSWYNQFALQTGSGETLSQSHAEFILENQISLLEAGADSVSTNTFGLTDLEIDGSLDVSRSFQLAYNSATLATEACRRASSLVRPRVIGTIGATTHLIMRNVTLEKELSIQLTNSFSNQAQALIEGGADLLHIERSHSWQIARAALEGIQAAGQRIGRVVPVMLSAGVEATGRMLDGTAPSELFDQLKSFGISVFGLVGGLDTLHRSLELRSSVDAPIAIFADVFLVGSRDGWMETVNSLEGGIEPLLGRTGVSVVGLGVGGRPEYVRAVAGTIRRRCHQ